MAEFHLSVKTISRSSGRSAVAAAAYRAADVLHDERTGRTHDYRRKRGAEGIGIEAPHDAPAWVRDRARLWNAAEAAERRKDSTVAREWEIALPHELEPAARRALAQHLARDLVERYGIAVDVAVHEPPRGGDNRNYHAHLLGTTRAITADGLGAKTRCLDGAIRGSAEVKWARQRWAQLCNDALAAAQVDARVDHRSLAARRSAATDTAEQIALTYEPESKVGPAATAMEQRGVATDLGTRRTRQRAKRDRARAVASELQAVESEIAAIVATERVDAQPAGHRAADAVGTTSGAPSEEPPRHVPASPHAGAPAGHDITSVATQALAGSDGTGGPDEDRGDRSRGNLGGHPGGDRDADREPRGGSGNPDPRPAAGAGSGAQRAAAGDRAPDPGGGETDAGGAGSARRDPPRRVPLTPAQMERIRRAVVEDLLRRSAGRAPLGSLIAESRAAAATTAPARRRLRDAVVMAWAARGCVVVEPAAADASPLHLDPDPRRSLGAAAGRVRAIDDRRGDPALPHIRFGFDDGGALVVAAWGLAIAVDSAAARFAAACRARLERWTKAVVRGAENLRLGVATVLARVGVPVEDPALRAAADATLARERADAAAQTSAQRAVGAFVDDLERWDAVQDRICVGYPDPTANALRQRLEAAARALQDDPRARAIVEADEDLAASHQWWLLPRPARAAAALRKRRRAPAPMAAGMHAVVRPEKTFTPRSREP